MEIFKRNYEAVVKRGLITYKTLDAEFFFKLKEETDEVMQELLTYKSEKMEHEIADCLVVCANWLIHRGVDVEKILIEIAEKNENRANGLKK